MLNHNDYCVYTQSQTLYAKHFLNAKYFIKHKCIAIKTQK